MCLILVAWQQHPSYPLIVAANRDEFYARPTLPAARWQDVPAEATEADIHGGRDLEAGGTWLGYARGGRFAAVTNVREPGRPPGLRSRGRLTADFLAGTAAAEDYTCSLVLGDYAGFNLLVSDGEALVYCTNRGAATMSLEPGIYGLSNHLLDTPWPKLASSKERFAAALGALPADEAFFALLSDDEIVPDPLLPATGVPLAWERILSAVFVRSPDYGTRASTVLLASKDASATLIERSFGPQGLIGETRLSIPSR